MPRGLNIKQALLDYNNKYNYSYTQKDVARRLWPDIKNSKNYIQLIINGTKKVSKEEINKICKMLECQPNKLLK